MSAPTISYKNHRFPPQIIAHAVWLYFRFPLSLRLVEEMLLERGIVVSYESIRRWGRKFGAAYVKRLRRKTPSGKDIWHLDEVVVSIGGRKHWLWRAVDQEGYVYFIGRSPQTATGAVVSHYGKLSAQLSSKPRIDNIAPMPRKSFASQHKHSRIDIT